ncbi:hypothetical protein GBA52_010915 [Prunus armeniaca]|nr:hypothetical protein GBA52_010915 [Prunus armeniaca]
MSVTLTSRNAEHFLPKLLDRLGKVKANIKPGDDQEVFMRSFKKIEDGLRQLEDLKLLPRLKLWEHTLFNQFTVLERRVDKLFLGDDESNTFNSLEAITDVLARIIENVDQINSIPLMKLMPSYTQSSSEFTHRSQPESGLTAAKKLSKELSQMGVEKGIYESRAMANLRRSYEHLEGTELRLCFLSFSIFPEESVIKKRPLIYWWIGEGFITATQDKTAEEVGEEIFGKLMKQGLIQPHGNVVNASSSSTSCTLHPWIRCMLIRLARDALLFHFDSSWPWMPSCQVSLCRRACLVFDQNPTSPANLINTPSRLGDLAKLKKLRRLSIYIGNEAVMHDNEFETLKEISSLRRLKISWTVVSSELKEKISLQSRDFSLPPDLEKLDLQGIPLKEVPSWLNPTQLKNLKKLYIRGGELCSLDHAGKETVTECKWRVEILRLKYLSNMKIELPKVEDQFPHLLYLEIKKDINEEGIFWSKSQGQKLSK